MRDHGVQTARTKRGALNVSLRALLVISLALAACSGGGDSNACGGIVEPLRVLTPSPATLAIDVGAQGQVSAGLSGGCADDDRTVRWTSGDALIATVDANGSVTGVAGGTVTLTATSFGNRASTTVIVTVRPKLATTIDAKPDVDTLSPLGARALSATVRDQNGALLPAAAVIWRSLTPALASVTTAGVVTAIGTGVATVEASTPTALAADSLRDTVRVLIVNACSFVRPVQLGTTFTGRVDASTCQNTFGFRVLNQYSVTGTTQAFYSVRLVPTVPSTLVPLNISSGFYGIPTADTAVTGLVVVRAGTFGFLVAGPTTAPGTFTVTTTLNPDPRLTCVVTEATTGVNFQTALTPSCTTRDVRLLPALAAGQLLRITGTAAGFPVILELRNFSTNALLQRAVATSNGGIATINYTNPASFPFVVLKVISSNTNVNDLVTIGILQ